MKRKKRNKRNDTPCFVLTQERIALTQAALHCLEQPLSRARHQEAKVAFAEETMLGIKKKLVTMKQSVGALCLVTFDANEKILLTQALRMHVLDLLTGPRTPQRARALSSCRKLLAQFQIDQAKA